MRKRRRNDKREGEIRRRDNEKREMRKKAKAKWDG